jgi:hypothetical protein
MSGFLTRTLERAFLLEAAKQLGEKGFNAHGRIFLRRTADGIHAWVGMNTATKFGLEANVVVGVRSQAVEKAVASCRELSVDALSPPTLSAHLGYLTPQKTYSPYRVFHPFMLSNQVRSILRDLDRWGEPVFAENRSLEAILNSLISGQFSRSLDRDYRVATIMHLLGQHEDADRFIQSRVSALENRAGNAAKLLREFGARLATYTTD